MMIPQLRRVVTFASILATTSLAPIGCGNSVHSITLSGDGGGPVVRPDASRGAPDAHVDAKAGADGGCPKGTIACGRACIFSQTDNQNCGECGNICGEGLSCINGACGCPAGLSFCDGQCVDAATDSNNCGACGKVCPTGMPCGGGACGCGAPTTNCNGVCVDESTDVQNCGACDQPCMAGLSCIGGKCMCPNGEFYCTPAGASSGACADVMTDPNNCGRCNAPCAAGESCVGGVCACGAGQTTCAGSGCVDLATDPDHCGSCTNVCASPLTCQSATCECAIATDTYCAGTNSCTDLLTDSLNCGKCGTSCGGAACVDGVCSNPLACNPAGPNTCTTPLTCLASGMCGCAPATPSYCSATNTCVNTLTDPNNCGTCSHVCGSGMTCVSGVCTGPTCTLTNGTACTPGATSPCCSSASGASVCDSVELTFGTYDTGSTFANECCLTAGQTVPATGATCCGYMVPNVTCLCQPNGHHCVDNGDCCDGDCTASHICGQTCVASTVGCELGDKCCSTNLACPTTNVCP